MSKVKVLFLAADPASANPGRHWSEQEPRLQLDEEIRAITTKVRAAEHRESLEFISRWAVRADDLLQTLNEVRPQIVHFSGHGSETGELMIVGRDGAPCPIPGDALASLFQTFRGDIRVVLLNACDSESQAENLTRIIDCAIGMSSEISDDAAITFSASFYRALGFGRSVRDAFEQGRLALLLEGVPEDDVPRLHVRPGVDADNVVLVDPARVASHEMNLAPIPLVHARDNGIAAGRDVNIYHGDTPGEKARKARDSTAVIRDELQWNLQRLASQITHTRINVPSGNPIPRRPGETKAQFEDRDRNWFAHEVEYVFSAYQQFSLDNAVHASQRANLASFDEATRVLINRAYAAVDEVRNRVFLYRDSMKQLSTSEFHDSRRRGEQARLHSRKAANALASLWFEILENWLMLKPDETALIIMQGILPQVLGDGTAPPPLVAGREGWRYALEQRARLNTEKMLLDLELYSPSSAHHLSPADGQNTAKDFLDALGRASLAYVEGRAENAVKFLEEALRFPDVPEDRRHFAKTSLSFLHDPDAFDGALGAYLIEVEDAGPAVEAGFRKGDVIIRYNGAPVTEPLVLSRLIPQARGAPSVAVEAVRDGERLTRHLKGGASLRAIVTALIYVESLAV